MIEIPNKHTHNATRSAQVTEERKVTVCRSCDGPPENSVLGILLVKKHGEDLVRLGIVHRPECPELEDEPEEKAS